MLVVLISVWSQAQQSDSEKTGLDRRGLKKKKKKKKRGGGGGVLRIAVEISHQSGKAAESV